MHTISNSISLMRNFKWFGKWNAPTTNNLNANIHERVWIRQIFEHKKMTWKVHEPCLLNLLFAYALLLDSIDSSSSIDFMNFIFYLIPLSIFFGHEYTYFFSKSQYISCYSCAAIIYFITHVSLCLSLWRMHVVYYIHPSNLTL